MTQTRTRITAWRAEAIARVLLAPGTRWDHVQAVGRKAERIATGLGDEGDVRSLVAAAFLHDIGYARNMKQSGYHPLDGAQFMVNIDDRVACLIAHHSGARFDAKAQELATEMVAFPRERSVVADLLDWCDMTTDPSGRDVTIEGRVEEVVGRYGTRHPVSVGVQLWLRSFRRPELRLRRLGLIPGATPPIGQREKIPWTAASMFDDMSEGSYTEIDMKRSNSSDGSYAEIETEAVAEGPDAARDLRAKEMKYALISSLMLARRRLQLTQQELAERTGIAQTEISRIERGRKSPTVATYSRLAAALNLEVNPVNGRGGEKRRSRVA